MPSLGVLLMLALFFAPDGGLVAGLARDGDRLLTVKLVAERLGISQRQVWKLTASWKLPAPVRVARSVRWRESDIAEYIRLGCPSREVFEAGRRQGVSANG